MGWQSDLRKDMRRLALTVPTLPPNAAWEGRPFSPVVGTTWWREMMLPMDSNTVTAGRSGMVQEDVVYQMSPYHPITDGITLLEDVISDIEAVFFPGLEVGGPTNSGNIVRVTMTPARTNESWRWFDVSIYCFVRRKSYRWAA